MPRAFMPCAYDEWEAPGPSGAGRAVFGQRASLGREGRVGRPQSWHWVALGPASGGAACAQALLRAMVFNDAAER